MSKSNVCNGGRPALIVAPCPPPSALFVEHVVKDPMHTPGGPITAPAFKDAVDKYVQKLPYFSSPGTV